MAGLELLYNSVLDDIASPQDALLCFVHWEMIRNGYKCLGTGDQPGTNDKRSELLPAHWNESSELYTLRYESSDGKVQLLVKAITVDSSVIFNVMRSGSEEVADMTVSLSDYVNCDHLQDFDRVFKNTEELGGRVQSGILSSGPGSRSGSGKGKEPAKSCKKSLQDEDPFRIPTRTAVRQPGWAQPMNPFAAGGADLDPFGGRPGGMIMDPLRAGFPRSGLDPSSGIPMRLPPGAVPPGARFDPFGPVGRPGPDPDHLPPPGYDDMFM
ncbi:proteasome inhibitor PI31 subunit-like [Acipenser oxyrinchus oxyrinchus]|uniref:Proteasome inhibitor PI31 subunit n=1 Tax=Acipenser oxyrinchus oxyrinchus TaxID=40147 RepID=A0AAD8CRG0_ACIOX|nr:proteasome inhibitor PI31 subunit-like [Acipenser oxyrinchus oxyrinchus]